MKDEDGETVAVASDANEKSAASGQTTTSGDSGSTGGGNAVKPAKNDAKSANGAGNTAKKTYDGPRKEFKKRYDGGGFLVFVLMFKNAFLKYSQCGSFGSVGNFIGKRISFI